MKRLRYALMAIAGSILLSTPALADDDRRDGRRLKAVDVCVDPNLDASINDNGDTIPFTTADGIAAAGMILPAGTLPTDGTGDPTCAAYAMDRIGTFFVRGIIVAGLPQVAADDLAYVDWHFRIPGVGAFDTTGPVNTGELGSTYPQTIVGGTKRFRGRKGEATVLVLAPGGFQIRVFLQ